MKCLICDREFDMSSDGRGQCYCCGSTIFLNDKSQPYIVKNNITFNRENFIFGVLSLLGMIGSFIFAMRINAGLTFIGLAYFLAPFLGLFQHGLFYKSYEFQNFMDLHRALISGRIRLYDFGSKFFIYSLLGIQITGLILVLIDIVI